MEPAHGAPKKRTLPYKQDLFEKFHIISGLKIWAGLQEIHVSVCFSKFRFHDNSLPTNLPKRSTIM